MAKIIENAKGRRTVKLSTDDVISIVREFQNISAESVTYSILREKLDKFEFYLPEE